MATVFSCLDSKLGILARSLINTRCHGSIARAYNLVSRDLATASTGLIGQMYLKRRSAAARLHLRARSLQFCDVRKRCTNVHLLFQRIFQRTSTSRLFSSAPPAYRILSEVRSDTIRKKTEDLPPDIWPQSEAAAALRILSERFNRVVAALKDVGVAEGDINTTNFSIGPI
jgi:hypothetical protein